MRVEIAYREGDRTAAKKYPESAQAVFGNPYAEPYQKRATEKLGALLAEGGRTARR